MKKPIRSISGIVPIGVVLKPRPCPHGQCLYCPSNPGIPNSYTEHSPAVARAKALHYDPTLQVRARLKVLEQLGHRTEKVELILIGGTLLAYPPNYLVAFVKRCFDALNGTHSSSLEQAQKINESARHRCVGLCLETRPDWCREEQINLMLKLGATRCELGVQALDDELYKTIKRGHSVKDVELATQLLKDAGFEVGYHLMLGLPGSNPEHDLKLIKKAFSEPFRPDGIKLYPTLVLPGSELELLYKQGCYEPYTTETLLELLIAIKQFIPPYCRIMRIARDVPEQDKIAGAPSNLRQLVRARLEQLGLNCACIRCREAGHAKLKGAKLSSKLKLKKMVYKASKGKEFFLSLTDSAGLLYAICRLRRPAKPFRPELENAMLLRRLQTFGRALAIGEKSNELQHRGYGLTLLKEAEKIAKKEGCDKLAILSAIGTRNYYRKFGYNLEGPYMTKLL